MFKNAKWFILLAFPLSFIGALAQSYNLKLSNSSDFYDFGVWDGLLVGAITAIFLTGFFLIAQRIVAMPKDLITGPLVPKVPFVYTDPSIYRQGLVFSLAFAGAGFGCSCSGLLFNSQTLGIGISQLIPGIAGSILLLVMWRSQEKPRVG
ncbi:MAG: hypothetical protein LV481_08145 [Methylacidiphilales bacterium]|nr:hypothetical protein [Candidatus Methylacidiphilales bacterium]